jgi:sugar O-acyltransferase (sialic acid O-acetyltransferase NeuD family)
MKPQIILIGGGGHCKSCIDVIEQSGTYQIAGLVDTPDKLGQKMLGYRYLASDDDLPQLVKEYSYFLITLGQTRNARRRVDLFEELKTLGARLPAVTSPFAYISQHSDVGEGTIVMHHALINAGARVGRNCIINTTALVEHDAVIEDHCHISTGAVVNGGVIIGRGSFFGSSAVSKEYTSIPANSFITANTLYRGKHE